MAFFDQVIAEVLKFGWLDWSIWLTALVYVWLSARQNPIGWAWGIISCTLWAYASFFLYNLWMDAILQVFYVAMGFVGLYKWKMAASEKQVRISHLSTFQNLTIIATGAVGTLLFGYFFDIYTPAAATYLDAFVTVFSIITTFLLVQKKLDNWAYWVVIDIVGFYLFALRGAYLLAFIMAIYTFIAASAFLQWRRELKNY